MKFHSKNRVNMVTKFLIILLLIGSCWGIDDDTGLVIVEAEDNITSPTIQKPNIIRLDTSFEDEEDYNSEPFIPTKEWQVVKKGQSIPAGLHVRLNFQTHVREAKLLDGDDGSRFQYLQKKDTAKAEGNEKSSESNVDEKKEVESGPKILIGEDLQKDEETKYPDRMYFTKHQLKEALKDFRDKFHDEDLKSDEQEIKRTEAIKKKFRSIEEIRKELEDTMGLSIKSDAQIMKLKVEVLKSINTTELEILNALDDLESYVHQIDNAVDLEKMKGLEVVIQYLNSSNPLIQEKAAKVLGSAVQSNPKAQKAALQHGSMPQLLRLVSYSPGMRLRKTALFALSALVRTHSDAQITFLKLNGLKKILQIFQEQNSLALKTKVITLVSDLIVEQDDVRLKMIKNGKLPKGKRTPLMSALINEGWCEILQSQLDPSVSDKDSEEKILSAITASTLSCKNSFIKSNLIQKLNRIRQKYENEIKNEDDVDFVSYLETFPDQIRTIIKKLESEEPVVV